LATFSALKGIKRDVAVILSSGYSQEDVAGHFTGDRPSGFIQKPFKVQDLRERIIEVMSAGGTTDAG
jgi:DNA-binding NtrC family response regulator